MKCASDVRGVGGEAGVCGDAAPVDLAWASAVLDAGEKQDNLLVLGDRRHGQMRLEEML